MQFDDKTLEIFLDKQLQLFPEEVAFDKEEAADFLDEMCACVCKNYKELKEYLEDGMDITGMSKEEILDSPEVFDLKDGRYLVVEG